MRTYNELVDAIIRAMPSAAELETLTDEQIQKLRKYGNARDNILYLKTHEWKEWRVANPSSSR